MKTNPIMDSRNFRALLVACCALSSICQNAVASSLTPGNILAADLDTGVMREYTAAGSIVQSFTFPDVDANGFPDLRDIVVGHDRNVQAFNGTFDPYLSTLTPVSGAISNRTFSGWSSVNNISYGGIGSINDYVFVTDMSTFGDGGADAAEGIIRFDMAGGVDVRFADSEEYQDLTIGRDGMLYALRGNGTNVDVFNPETMGLTNTVRLDATLLSADVRGIAVDADNTIYAAAWNGLIYKASSSGGVLDFINSTGNNLTDIDLDNDGNLVIGDRFGKIILTDINLDSVTSFNFGSNTMHVAFTTPLVVVPEPSTLLLSVIAGPFLRRRSRRSVYVRTD